VRSSRWLEVAGYAVALLVFGGALALTSYAIEEFVDAGSPRVVTAPVVPAQAEPVQQPAVGSTPAAQPPVAAEPAPTRLAGTEAIAKAKPTEVTLAPARIELPRPAPVAPRAAPAPAPAHTKPKAAPQTKVATMERAPEVGTAALLLTAAPPPAPAGRTPAKTRGLDELVVPLERAAEMAQIGQVAPVQLVVASEPELAPLRPIERPQPAFPSSAAKDGVTAGRVLAQLTVNGDGSIGRVDILEANPRNVFDREVRRVLSGWRYEAPGQARQTTVELVFKLEQ
jgi:protein TonB